MLYVIIVGDGRQLQTYLEPDTEQRQPGAIYFKDGSHYIIGQPGTNIRVRCVQRGQADYVVTPGHNRKIVDLSSATRTRIESGGAIVNLGEAKDVIVGDYTSQVNEW